MKTIKERIVKNKSSVIAISLSLGVFATLGTISISSVNNFLNLAQAEKSAEENILSLESTLSYLKDIETGSRGYVITEDINYLEPYNDASLLIKNQVKLLRNSLEQNSNQTEKLDYLVSTIDKKLKIADSIIKITQNEGTQAGKKAVLTHEDKSVMDRIRFLIGKLKQEERNKIIAVHEKRLTAANVVTISTISLLLIEFIIILTSLISLNREMQARLSALKQVERKYLELTKLYNKENTVYNEATKVLNDVIYTLRHGGNAE